MIDPQREWQRVRETFQKIWGYPDFRPPQDEIIRSLLNGFDTLIVMPTGGGKSICFQLPALLQNGLTIVISPLVALMENQVQELKERNLPAALIHSQLPKYLRKQTLKAIAAQKLRLLYLSPETLLSVPVWEKISQPNIKINGLILDEAHCLVQWGDTFRPAYRRLGAVRSSLLKHKPDAKIAIAAFTATADPTAQKIITNTLQLKQPKTFLLSPYRQNLHLKVKTVWTPKGRRQQTLKYIEKRKRQTGLIYVRSRRESEELEEWLSSLKYQTAAYHAGLIDTQRRKIENDWLEGKIKFVICTSAFGMGINKPNVRWVVHFHSPLLLSEYLQEIGRGGRDGKIADTLTLISEPTGLLNPEDKQRNQFFISKLQKQYQKAEAIAKKIPDRGDLNSITEQFKDGKIALALLHSVGQLEWIDPFNYRRNNNKDSSSFAKLNSIQQRFIQETTRFLHTRTCRWQFLLNAFGFTEDAKDFQCGHCDNCRSKGRRQK
ncbi:MAG: RecQ family ATP-dependent DNA helicase [Prochloraceae cyanobacterium]|nr:RecQ family ATP-dependent DNA helicase [Prochloraceae cyanobacterium]